MNLAFKNTTVDLDQFKMWLNGVLLSFKNGSGIVVNELECQEAEDSLLRGEEVLVKRGSRLTGTKLVLRRDTVYEERCEVPTCPET
ncbi:MAG: hypothetical protein ABIJ08_05850 [Nanoarchaeota archaeon]